MGGVWRIDWPRTKSPSIAGLINGDIVLSRVVDRKPIEAAFQLRFTSARINLLLHVCGNAMVPEVEKRLFPMGTFAAYLIGKKDE